MAVFTGSSRTRAEPYLRNHGLQLCWGHAKLENIAVNNVYDPLGLLKISGGHIDPRVRAERTGTVEGDEQGQVPIIEHISALGLAPEPYEWQASGVCDTECTAYGSRL